MQKKLELRLTEKEIELLVSLLNEKAEEVGASGNISKCCDISMIAQKIQSAANFAN